MRTICCKLSGDLQRFRCAGPATDGDLKEYLDWLKDDQLDEIRQGKVALTLGITDPKVRKVIDDALMGPTAQVQAKREQRAQEAEDQRQQADPRHQRNMFVCWVSNRQQEILNKDSARRREIEAMENKYRSDLHGVTNLRQVTQVFDEWADRRREMLEARTEAVVADVKLYVDEAFQHRVWQLGTKDDRNQVADEFAAALKRLAKSVDSPVENQLVQAQKSYSGLIRDVRQINEDAERVVS